MTIAEELLASVLFLALCAGGGFAAGYRHATQKTAAGQLAQERAAVAAYVAAAERGNASSARLAQAETRIQTQTAERIKHVPKVTAGRRCLEPAAVGLLNASAAAPVLPAAAGQPVAADAAAPAASDTDVAGWIASASGQYETCAARLNGLIDYQLKQAPFTIASSPLGERIEVRESHPLIPTFSPRGEVATEKSADHE